ncbi:ABC transporter substrate-binding protein [Balneatrix alpica]|uniref:ABC transporter substrate-binding protein n=1 Tax=Balneatrix alpica TaxID=75684 RepID=A0ABV5Z9X9_9GAMM|nr:ABC transporter substrate-binding protein [Balneatrix alpica]
MNNKSKKCDLQQPVEGISRRRFLAGSLAAGAALGLGGLSLSQAYAGSLAPVKGGKLTVGGGQGSTTDSLDPATYNNDFLYALAYGVFNNLTEIDTDGKLIPELAESWQASADAKVWAFRLRKDVTFHDGKSLSVEDVIASLNHHRKDGSKSGAKPLVEGIADMRAADAHTLVIELKDANADFPFILSDYHLGIRQAKGEGIDAQSAIGTGAYILQSFEPGVRATYLRNPQYWKSGRAHINEIEILVIADAAARLNALMTGQVDLIDRPDLKTIKMLERAPGVKVEQRTGTLHYTLPMHANVAPFQDNNVRLALKHAINREEMVQKVLKGYGVVGNDHPIGPSNRFFNHDLAIRSYDPDKAAFYLKQAGMSELKVQLSLAETAFDGALDAGALFAESAKKAGITIEILREPNDGYWSNVWLKKPFSASYWGGRPTEDWMFSTVYAKGVSWNESNWEHARFNQLLVAARSELDDDKRRAMYGEMQQLVRDEGSTIIPMFGNYVVAMRDRVQHDEQVAANWDLDGQRFMERWWVA